MRILLAIVILAALGWSGWWFVQSTARDRAMTGWLDERRAAGWVAEAEDVRVRGFPNRVDTVVTGLDLSDPDAGWSWHADGLQVLSLSYKPNHVIAVLHRRAGGRHPLRDAARHQRPPARLGDLPADAAARARPFDLRDREHGASAATPAGPPPSARRSSPPARRPTARPSPTTSPSTPRAWRCPPRSSPASAPTACCPPTIGPIALDATLVFDRPWDRAHASRATTRCCEQVDDPRPRR